MSLRFYTLAHYLLLPFLLLYLCWRGLKNAEYWRHWGQRFGYAHQVPESRRVLWIHAVSVGEVQAAVPLAKRLRLQYPEAQLLMTTTTPTGSHRVKQAFGHHVPHCYVPYDLPGAVRRFLDRAHPEIAIIMETELWPNMFALCRHRSVPVIVANARLSERAALRYQRVAGLLQTMLAGVAAVAAQTPADAERFIALGAPPEKVAVTGSIKFDFEVPAGLLRDAREIRAYWGAKRPVWIAASTHEHEDQQVLDAFARVLRVLSHTLLVLVPRHPERFDKVASLCRRHGYDTARRSQEPSSCNTVDVFIGDSMGELPLFYGASDVAFVGGSLVPVGGHNPLEPAALGVPIVVGPHLFNFAEISTRLCAAGAARIVNNARELADVVIEFLGDRDRRQRMGQQGKLFVEQNRGALDQVVRLIDRLMKGQACGAGSLGSNHEGAA
jgi:3-deoxy-D-manno-octulosonic-acid transferase